MATVVERLVGKKSGDDAPAITHGLGGRRWTVDREAAGQVMAWVRREGKAWRSDLEEMATHFPHWALVGGKGMQPIRCSCGGPMAPLKGGLRCVVCNMAAADGGTSTPADSLIWMGQLPVLARAEASFAKRRAALQSAGFAETEAGGLLYLLVPLAVVYPTEWPSLEPGVYYAPNWLAALELPLANGSYHLVGGGRACLFGWGHWRPMSVAAVLQQRTVNHVVSLLKIAAGSSPEQAFIGRVAH